MKYILGLDIGGTKCAVTLALSQDRKAPQILKKLQFPTPARDPKGTMQLFLNHINDMLKAFSLPLCDIYGIGISCGGPLDSKNGIILSPPNLPGWDDIHICEFFEEKTGIPCRLQNDANACAVAEWKWGAGKDYSSIVFLTFGTGLGAGIIIDGKLLRGATDMAGEIGHVRLKDDGPIGYGKKGSCEGFCSGGGIRQLGILAMNENGENSLIYKSVNGDKDKVSAKLIAELARQGDPISKKIYDNCASMLGSTVAILCDVLNPQAVIIGGIYMRSDDLLTQGIKEKLRSEALCPCEILKAGLGENVGDFAALSIAEGGY